LNQGEVHPSKSVPAEAGEADAELFRCGPHVLPKQVPVVVLPSVLPREHEVVGKPRALFESLSAQAG
jgi:hypothetical protein